MNTVPMNRRDTILIGVGFAVVCCAMLADSSVNGHVSPDSEELNDAVQRLQQIPAAIGSWTSVDEAHL